MIACRGSEEEFMIIGRKAIWILLTNTDQNTLKLTLWENSKQTFEIQIPFEQTALDSVEFGNDICTNGEEMVADFFRNDLYNPLEEWFQDALQNSSALHA